MVLKAKVLSTEILFSSLTQDIFKKWKSKSNRNYSIIQESD